MAFNGMWNTAESLCQTGAVNLHWCQNGMIANNGLIMSPWLQLSSELTQAPISQLPLTPITANGLPDEARGVIPALMINNIKMKTKSILQSF